ncbi:MAG TPA: MscL family protein, partial [Ilumatobacter sp.]|nr:MscL family protein [Ilumatobacter sp.]
TETRAGRLIAVTLREGEGGEPPTRVSVGLVIDAAISFVLVAFVLFLIIKTYNRSRETAEGTPAGPTEIELLTEIRDALKNR